MKINKEQRKKIIKYLLYISKLFLGGIIFSNIFLKKYFNLWVTISIIALSFTLFIIALLLIKEE